MGVSSATAFRWRPVLAGRAADVVRIREDDGVPLALLANGYECGFSSCWPPASGLMLDLFEAEWASASGAVLARLSLAFERARGRFLARAPALARGFDVLEDVPSAILLAVAIEETAMHAAWMGGDVALLARGSRVAGQTTPHTLRERAKREMSIGDANLARTIPNVLTRCIGSNAPDQDPAEFATFEAAPGDTVILLSKTNFNGASLRLEDAAAAAAVRASPGSLAERLADQSFANPEVPYAAVATLRFDE